MKLAIVIVHYNASEDLARCLESLAAYPPACEHAVVVVDNASRDGGLSAVQARFPAVHWLLNSENLGYARGANRGMAAVAAEYYLVLNPDIVAQPGAVDAVLAFADAQPRAGLIGPQLLNVDGSVQDSCRRFYTFGTLLLRRTFVGKLFPHSRIVDRHLMRDFDHQSGRPVDWVLGGCLLVRRAAKERTGPMDERFFLYFEDVDWCYRMWQAGWEVLYTPAARFVHRHRRESGKGAWHRTWWHHLGSLIFFYEKWSLVVYLLKKWRDPLAVLWLWLGDMVALSAAFLGAYAVRAVAGRYFAEALFPLAEYRPLWLFAALLASVTFLLTGRYRAGRGRRPPGVGRQLQQVLIVGLLLLASTYLSHQQVYSRAVLLLFIPLFALTTAAAGDLLGAVARRVESGYLTLERTLLIGPPEHLRDWLERVREPRQHGLDPVGYLAEATPGAGAALPPLAGGEVPWLGGWSDLGDVVERYRISQVVVWGRVFPAAAEIAALAALRRRRIRVRWRTDAAWLLAAGARAEPFGADVSAVFEPGAGSLPRAAAARTVSLVAALFLAVLALPPYLWLRLSPAGRRRGQPRQVACQDGWGGEQPFRCLCRPDGRVLPLWWQWPLAGELLRGRLDLVGGRLTGPGEATAPPRPEQVAQVWRGGWRRPGLTGTWAAAGTAGEGFGPDRGLPAGRRLPSGLAASFVMLRRVARRLLLDPGGLGRLPSDPASASPEQTLTRANREDP